MKPILFHTPGNLHKIIWYHLYIIILAITPILISLLVGFIGYCLKCHINEAGTDPCIRMGISFGNFLNPMGAAFWLCLVTVPLGIVATIILVIAAINDTIYHKNNAE